MKEIEYTESESKIQKDVRLTAAYAGWDLFRNNVGALFNKAGRIVRYGLANSSKAQNKKLKSGDLIGWRTIVITQDMVGKKIAQFVSIECKEEGWVYTGTEEEIAQLNWLNKVRNSGGFATFCNNAKNLLSSR